MLPPPKSSIKQKVMLVILLTSITVLLVAATAFVLYDLVTVRQTMSRYLAAQARLIAQHSDDALSHRNEAEAASILASLRADPHIVAAAIYNAQGKLFAKYPTQIPEADLPAKPQSRSHEFARSKLTLFEPILRSGKLLGTLYLRANLVAQSQRLQLYGGISLLIILGSLLVAIWLSSLLQRRISNPIIALAETARNISERQDYSLRAQKLSDDELGLLTDSFNQMLEHIDVSDTALRASEAQLRLVTDQVPVLLAHMDREYRYKFVNRPYAEHYGRKPDAIIGKTPIEVVGLELFERARPYIEQALAGQPAQFELETQTATGEHRWSEVKYIPEKDASGEIVGFVAMHTDITERKRAEETFRRLAAIVESSDEAIVSKNLDGIIASWNGGAERLFGYKADEVIGRPITLLMPPERVNEEPGILDRIRRGERIEHYETIRQRKDGKLIEISLTVSPVRDGNGKIIGASKIARDISGQKNAERELARAHQEILAALRAKDEFLAALSHELRTPLNPVLLVASEAAADSGLPPAAQASFEMIRRNVELEARLIDDLLDLTRITCGKLTLEKRPLDLHTPLVDALAIVQVEAEKKHIELTRDLETTPHRMMGDPVRLQQIFWNVLKNAVKFTPDGGKIKVESRTLVQNRRICIKVVDTGIGLTSEEMGHIFDAFVQGEHAAGSSIHRFGGLGLGLTISRKLVELHGGAMYAASPGRDQGATFTVEFSGLNFEPKDFPATPADQPGTVGLYQLGKTPGKRILLVEDHEATRVALAQLLSRRNYQVLAANSVAQARGLAQLERFDLVISDIGLPDGDGYALMSELRDKFGLRGIALTGYGMEQDVTRGKNAGFIAHLIKPIRVDTLERALSAAGGDRRQA